MAVRPFAAFAFAFAAFFAFPFGFRGERPFRRGGGVVRRFFQRPAGAGATLIANVWLAAPPLSGPPGMYTRNTSPPTPNTW